MKAVERTSAKFKTCASDCLVLDRCEERNDNMMGGGYFEDAMARLSGCRGYVWEAAGLDRPRIEEPRSFNALRKGSWP